MKRITKSAVTLALLIITLLPLSIDAQETEGHWLYGDVKTHNQDNDRFLRLTVEASFCLPAGASASIGWREKYSGRFSVSPTFDVITATDISENSIGGFQYGPKIRAYYRLSKNTQVFCGISYLSHLGKKVGRTSGHPYIRDFVRESIFVDPSYYVHSGTNIGPLYFAIEKRLGNKTAYYNKYIAQPFGDKIELENSTFTLATWRVSVAVQWHWLWN